MAHMPKYKVEHYEKKISRHFDPLIEEQELLIKQYKTEATDRIIAKLSKKMGADKILDALAKAEELSPGQCRAFDVEGSNIAIFNVDGNYYAIDNICTHDYAPLTDGDVEGTTVICPWHMAEFDLKTGAVLTPPATEDLKSYKVSITNGDLQIEV